MRVLLVEDDEMISESLREALRRQRFAASRVRGLQLDPAAREIDRAGRLF